MAIKIGEMLLKAHLINWSGDLHGARLHTTFVRRLRDELRFDSVEAQKEQLAQDVKLAGALLAGRSADLGRHPGAP